MYLSIIQEIFFRIEWFFTIRIWRGGLLDGFIKRKLTRILCFCTMLQNFVEKTNAKDASGNIVLGDIGVHLQQEVSDCNSLTNIWSDFWYIGWKILILIIYAQFEPEGWELFFSFLILLLFPFFHSFFIYWSYSLCYIEYPSIINFFFCFDKRSQL